VTPAGIADPSYNALNPGKKMLKKALTSFGVPE